MSVNKSYLTGLTDQEKNNLITEYKTCSTARLDELCKKFGYKNRASLQDAMNRRLGVKRESTPTQFLEKEVIHQPYPDLKLKPFIIGKAKRDVEDITIVRADAHVGKKTENYDLATYKKRVDRLTDKVLRIIELHHPVKRVHVFYLGDIVQGENPFQGSKIEETECGAYSQIHEHAVPTESKFLNSIAQCVESVEADCVWGNHGVYGREATKRTNWDNFFYKSLADANINQKHLTIIEPVKFYQLVNVYGFIFFLFHGNQVRATSGIPLFALRRKLQEWYAYVGGFNYAYGGHFHTWGADSVNSVSDYQLCPPLVTGDEWALEVVGRASSPVQLCFGIHPKQGRTFQYHLYTDDLHLPKAIE